MVEEYISELQLAFASFMKVRHFFAEYATYWCTSSWQIKEDILILVF